MSYYYLISSLPDLSLEINDTPIDFEETFGLIRRNLLPEDEQSFQYLIYPNDIRNLLSVLFHEFQDLPQAPFKKPSVFTGEEMVSYKQSGSNFPDFMHDFLQENEDRFPTMSMREMEDTLMAGFHEEVEALDGDFLAQYFSFQRDLKSLIASFHFNAFDFLSRPNIDDAERLISQIAPDRSPSTTIAKDHPYVEDLTEVLSEDEPKEIERFIDRILWDFLNEKNMGYFSKEEVFAYTIKLLLVQRWSTLDPAKGSERFNELYEEIKNNVRSPKTRVI